MLYREIIAVFSQIHTKHINTLCAQNVELLNVKQVVRIVTTGLLRFHDKLHVSASCISFYPVARPALNGHPSRPCGPSGYSSDNLNSTGHAASRTSDI